MSKNSQDSVHIYVRFPRWIEYSGLPLELNKRYGPQAWSVFKKLVEFDWMWNQERPDYFDVTHEEIAEPLGLSRDTISKYVNLFAKDSLIEYHPGQYTRSKSRFRIIEPLLVANSIDEISYKLGGNKGKKGRPAKARYTQKSVGDDHPLSGGEAEEAAAESVGDSGKSVGDSGDSLVNSDNKEIRKRLEREVEDTQTLLKNWNNAIESKRVRGAALAAPADTTP